MKLYLRIVILFFCSLQTFYGQQDDGVISLDLPVRNSLTFNRYLLNPTFSFVREQDRYLNITNKREWVQFEDAPTTYFANYSGRLRENIGVGVGLFQENRGVLTTFGGVLNFAYNAQIQRDNNLTFGLNVGAYSSGLNTGIVVTNFSDPSLDNVPSNFLVSVSPGINYGFGLFDFGVSLNNAVLYNISTSELIENDPQQAIQGHLMYTGYLSGNGFLRDSKFSALARSQFGEDTTVSGLVMLTVPMGIWAQAGYDTLYGASAGVGLNITENIAIEYNYEQALGDLTNFGPSHEITLAYRFVNKERYNYSSGDEVAGLFSKQNKRVRKPKKKIDKAQAEANRKLAQERREQRRLLAEEKRLAEQAKREQLQAEKQAELEAKEKEAEVNEALEQAKAEEEAYAKRIAEEKAKEEAERLAAEQERLRLEQEAKLKAQAEAEERAAEAERLRLEKEAAAAEQERLRLEQEAKKKAEAEERAAEAERLRLEKEAAAAEQERLRLEQEAKKREEAEARAAEQERIRLVEEALEKAKAEEAAERERMRLEEEAQKEADAEALATEQERRRLEDEAKEKAVAEALAAEQEKLRLEEEVKRKAEAERLAAEKLAREEAERLKLEEEAKENESNEPIPTDDIGKSMVELAEKTQASANEQNELLERLSAAIEVKNQDLIDLRKENDLSEKGIVSAPKPFKSVSAENAKIENLKSDLDKTIADRNKEIEELQKLYDERTRVKSLRNDEVTLTYKRKIERLKAEQAAAIETKNNLTATLADIKVATEIERKRRIKRAVYDSDKDRYDQDRAKLSVIKQTTKLANKPIKEEDFDFGEAQSDNIQILKNVQNVDRGYYLIVAVHNDSDKRDDFVRKMVASGRADVDFFYDVKTSKYYIYYEKFDTVEQANNAVESKIDRPYNAKMSVVKIEN
ncbi:MAG: PorP/SprF family type IX secretion system membrane protein [Bacteroidota bacterium]